jgi:SUMO ligase MMS21 Smc5/6 complex component
LLCCAATSGATSVNECQRLSASATIELQAWLQAISSSLRQKKPREA